MRSCATTLLCLSKWLVLISCLCLLVFTQVSISLADTATYSDDLKRVVTIKIKPIRIVSLAPSITEILFAIGLNEEIVGVTQFSNYPPEAAKKPRVGSYVKLNIEAIVELSPDLIVATADGNPREIVERLESLGLSVFVIYPKDINDIYRNIRAIAMITGKKENGEKLARSLKKRIDMISAKTSRVDRRKVFFQLSKQPLYTVAPSTFIARLIRLAGGVNIVSSTKIRYPVYSMEEVVRSNPEYIFSTVMGTETVDLFAFWKRWDTIDAVREGNLFTINPDLINRPSPRIADGLETLAKIIHPEIFTETNATSGQDR